MKTLVISLNICVKSRTHKCGCKISCFNFAYCKISYFNISNRFDFQFLKESERSQEFVCELNIPCHWKWWKKNSCSWNKKFLFWSWMLQQKSATTNLWSSILAKTQCPTRIYKSLVHSLQLSPALLANLTYTAMYDPHLLSWPFFTHLWENTVHQTQNLSPVSHHSDLIASLFLSLWFFILMASHSTGSLDFIISCLCSKRTP